MKRIRYKSHDNGTLTSNPIPLDLEVIYVNIYKDFHVIVINSKHVELSSDTARNLPEAKRKAKLLLKKLGVNFLDEVRVRKSKLGVLRED